MKKTCVIILLILSIVLLCACNEAGQYLIFRTFVDVNLEGKGAKKVLGEIESTLNDIERDMSVLPSSSYVYKINNAKANEKIKVDSDFMSLLKVAKNVYEKSNGAFDPTIFPLVELWEFSADNYTGLTQTIPTDDKILEKKALVGFNKITLDEKNLTVSKSLDDVKIDLGGIAKGYALSKIMALSSGLKGILNVGGNIGARGRNITVGLQNPRGEGYIGTFTLNSGESVSTSGDYERHYMIDGINYHHIISPFTGYPTGIKDGNNIISVSIISSDYALTDALSTAVMVLGVDKGKKLINDFMVKGIIVTDGETIVVGDIDYKKA